MLFFRPTLRRSLTGPLDYEHLQTLVDGLLEGPNLFYAAGRRPLRVGDDADRAPSGEAVPTIG